MLVYFGPYTKRRWYHRLFGIEPKYQRRYVKIHNYDTWSMDQTLAHIIVPMLKQLKDTTHGSPKVDNEDVPRHLRATKRQREAYEKNGRTDKNFHQRWQYVLDQMIFSFECIADGNWEEQYYTGDHKFNFLKNGDGSVFHEIDDDDTFEIDFEGLEAHQQRIQLGLNLFGKYFQSLWD